MSFETAVQTAVYSQLISDAPLVALVTGIYDAVPQTEKFPYVTIGEDVHNEWDTVETLGSDCSITIHTWSRARGRVEVKNIQKAIYDALHRAELVFPNHEFHMINFESSQSFTDADGLTRHGVQTFRILVKRI